MAKQKHAPENQDANVENQVEQTAPDATNENDLDDIFGEDAEAETEAEAETDEQLAARLVAEKKLADRKAESASKIAEFNKKIADAKKSVEMWRLREDDPESVEIHEIFAAKNPNWFTDKVELVTDLEKQLADYRRSLLSPEQLKLAAEIYDLEKQLAKIQAELTAKRLEQATKYPETASKPKTSAPAKGSNAKATGQTKEGIIPFTGTLLSAEEVTAKVKALADSGITSEVEMVQKIYGNDFTCTADAAVNPHGNGNPRAQIHGVRMRLGLVVKKA